MTKKNKRKNKSHSNTENIDIISNVETDSRDDYFTRIYQFNLHKALACNVDLYQLMRRDKREGMGMIAGIQEPNIGHKNGVITHLPGSNLIYHRECNRKTPTRAAIYHSSDVDLQPFFEYMGPDIATAIWSYDDNDTDVKKHIVVTSVYMDSDNGKVWPDKFYKLVNQCYKDKVEILILTDSNAHSTTWGERDTNARGVKVDHMLLEFNLVVIGYLATSVHVL